MITLYKIESELQALLGEYSTCEDEERSAELLSKIEQLDVDRDRKLFGLVSAYKNMRGDLEAHEIELARLNKAKKRIESSMERIENYLRATIGEGAEWSSGVHSIKWRPSERCELKEGIDVNSLPPCYTNVTYKANISLLKEDLKLLGAEEGGAKHFAEIKKYWNLKVG
jgi:hypothetical protein